MEYKDRLFVESLERGFEVLRAFEGHESLGLAEIAEKAGITRSAAQRFTHTLERFSASCGAMQRAAGG